MKRRSCGCLFASLTIGFWMGLFLSLSFAEEAKPPAAGLEPPKAEAPAAAPSAAAAATAPAPEPKPDPAGTVTGDRSNVFNAAGDSFMISEPTDKSDPDYAKKRKEFEEFQAQAAKEPLTLRLADSVGRGRIATNFTWTLATGYLVTANCHRRCVWRPGNCGVPRMAK